MDILSHYSAGGGLSLFILKIQSIFEHNRHNYIVQKYLRHDKLTLLLFISYVLIKSQQLSQNSPN